MIEIKDNKDDCKSCQACFKRVDTAEGKVLRIGSKTHPANTFLCDKCFNLAFNKMSKIIEKDTKKRRLEQNSSFTKNDFIKALSEEENVKNRLSVYLNDDNVYALDQSPEINQMYRLTEIIIEALQDKISRSSGCKECEDITHCDICRSKNVVTTSYPCNGCKYNSFPPKAIGEKDNFKIVRHYCQQCGKKYEVQ